MKKSQTENTDPQGCKVVQHMVEYLHKYSAAIIVNITTVAKRIRP